MKTVIFFMIALISYTAQASDLREYVCTSENLTLTLFRFAIEKTNELEIEFRGEKPQTLQSTIASRKGHLAIFAVDKNFREFSFSLTEPSLVVEPDSRGIINYQGHFTSTLSMRVDNNNEDVALKCRVTDYTAAFFAHAFARHGW